jgi:hypothetical protein
MMNSLTGLRVGIGVRLNHAVDCYPTDYIAAGERGVVTHVDSLKNTKA